jgi:hypothetical protein
MEPERIAQNVEQGRVRIVERDLKSLTVDVYGERLFHAASFDRSPSIESVHPQRIPQDPADTIY